jgi:hypothetical protein
MVYVPRVLIVGINPSSARDIGRNTTWRRLPCWADFLGIDKFSFTNCIYTPGPYKFSDVDLDLIKSCTEGHDRVVALGNFASKVLQKINVNHFTLPHPSGLNRKLNDKAFELDQLVKCKEYIYG